MPSQRSQCQIICRATVIATIPHRGFLFKTPPTVKTYIATLFSYRGTIYAIFPSGEILGTVNDPNPQERGSYELDKSRIPSKGLADLILKAYGIELAKQPKAEQPQAGQSVDPFSKGARAGGLIPLEEPKTS